MISRTVGIILFHAVFISIGLAFLAESKGWKKLMAVCLSVFILICLFFVGVAYIDIMWSA